MWAKRILANSSASDSALIVLLALGETADKDGLTRATTAELARWAKVSDRQARRDLSALQRLGEIEIHTPAAGRGRNAVYRILVTWERGFWRPDRKPKRRTSIYPL